MPLNPFLPDFGAPFGPTPSVTPFTYRDGETMLRKVDHINKYIDRVLIPWMEENYESLGAAFAMQAQILITAVNEAIQAVIDDAIEVQDAVVAGILDNAGSETRESLDALYGAKTAVDTLNTLVTSGRLSQATLDTRYALKTAFDSLDTAVTNLITTVGQKADKTYVDAADDAIEAVINNPGRLGQTALDIRYKKNPTALHAVFVGSSNSHPNYGWTQGLCTKRGWVHHNYSINGGSFSVPTHPDSFESQIENAIADASYANADVGHVFITDMSNDIRGNGSVAIQAAASFSMARAAFPNARIIMVPVVYTHIPVHMNDEPIRTSVSKRYAEAVEAGIAYDIEVIDNTWSWFWDANNWLEAPGSYHLNNPGYTRLIWYIEQYLDGGNYDNQIPWTNSFQLVSPANMGINFKARRINGQVTVSGQITSYIATAQDTDLCTLAPGCGPMEAITVIGGRDTREADCPLWIYPNGTVRALKGIPGGTSIWYSASYSII